VQQQKEVLIMVEDVVVRDVNCTLSARSCHFEFDEPSEEGKEQTRPVICIAVSKNPQPGTTAARHGLLCCSCTSFQVPSGCSKLGRRCTPIATKFSSRVPQQQYVSPPAPTNNWFQPFIHAANLVKHVSFQPSMMTGPVHVH